jgi:hypothetical protein
LRFNPLRWLKNFIRLFNSLQDFFQEMAKFRSGGDDMFHCFKVNRMEAPLFDFTIASTLPPDKPKASGLKRINQF